MTATALHGRNRWSFIVLSRRAGQIWRDGEHDTDSGFFLMLMCDGCAVERVRRVGAS
jgi:hypothetical protein